ncbi:sugar ABC transporter substrate-binding protein [Streptobacillus felis]|uniref:Sugar ABC transporter substrate-binding protein n=1 Tax=Streptobacillus felis TaxID=1384509 RepID=A0A7Z0PGY6_9FUSO|nr:sugar ABC transporter substrate-binding protein [Streptobacillus felis]NYV27850.1 sugar ABC transporter substrate-binding protein [Streptobacillus felis]
MKKMLIALMSIFVLLFTVSCGSEKTETKEGKIKIRFATWDNAEDLDDQQKMVDAFNAGQDKIEVVLEAYGSNYDTKITASMGSGDAPDVMYMWNYPKYSKGLLPLDELISKEGKEFGENYYEALWNYNSFEGKKLGMPVGYTTHVLYFNKDLFDSAGVSYPTPEWTWNDVVEASRKITNAENKVFGFAFPLKPDPYDYEMFAWSNGSAFVGEDGNPVGYLNSENTIKPFEVFQTMIKENIATTTEDYGEKSFILGKTAMYINGAWSLNRLKEKGVNFGVELLPKFNGNESASILSSSGVSISATSKNPEAAWEFVKYWTSAEMNKNRLGYELPVLKTVVDELKITEDPIMNKFYTMLEKSVKYTPASFVTQDWSELSEKLELALEQILNKNSFVDPKVALEEASK